MNLSVMFDGSEQIRYQNPAVPIYIVYGTLGYFTNMTALCHWHEDIELLLPIKGYLSYNVNGHHIHIAEGNAIFVNSRQMHYGFSADGTDSIYICICFKPDLLRAHTYFYEQYVLPVLTNSGLPYLLLEKENPVHTCILDLIKTIGNTKERDMRLMGKFYELWQEVYSLAEVKQSTPPDENLQFLRKMMSFISVHYSERISLTQIASAGGVCRSKCCQIFKKYMGHTPNDYLNSLRLEKSMELLRTTDMTATEIAFHCGFNSASYFAEIFKKQKGCSPKEYRKKIVSTQL